MCRNDLELLLKNFDLHWESQGFKARLEDLEMHPGRKTSLNLQSECSISFVKDADA